MKYIKTLRWHRYNNTSFRWENNLKEGINETKKISIFRKKGKARKAC